MEFIFSLNFMPALTNRTTSISIFWRFLVQFLRSVPSLLSFHFVHWLNVCVLYLLLCMNMYTCIDTCACLWYSLHSRIIEKSRKTSLYKQKNLPYKYQKMFFSRIRFYHAICALRIERHGRVVSTPASYSGSPGFKSRPGYRLSWLFFCGFTQSLQASVGIVR
jgi:hypothetical protein